LVSTRASDMGPFLRLVAHERRPPTAWTLQDDDLGFGEGDRSGTLAPILRDGAARDVGSGAEQFRGDLP